MTPIEPASTSNRATAKAGLNQDRFITREVKDRLLDRAPASVRARRPMPLAGVLTTLLTLGMICLAGLLLHWSLAAAQDDFLQPDQAFRISGEAAGADAVLVSWDIEPGYYLYKSKFRFASRTPGFDAGRPALPEAETRRDEFFGDVEIYRDRVQARLALQRSSDAGDIVQIEATSQGCADAGLCYPPHKQRLWLELPRLAAVPDQAQAPHQSLPPATATPPPVPMPVQGRVPLTALTATNPSPTDVTLGDVPLAGDGTAGPGAVAQSLGLVQSLGLDDDILPAEEAFRFSAEVATPNGLALTWQIAPDTYLYQEKIELALESADGVQLGHYELPPAQVMPDTVRPDGSIGDVAIYHGEVDVRVPLLRAAAEPTAVTLVAKFQGCAERGICYPPVTERVALELPVTTATVALAQSTLPATESRAGPTATGPATGGSAASERVSEQDRIAGRLAETGVFGAVTVFFGLGLLLAFTPCVFPMIPILSGIIAGQGDTITTRKAFMLSLAYVLAMALTYAVVGVVAGLFGANLQAAFQSPWVLTVFAAVFVALALSMFGFYDLQLPSSLQTKLTEISNKQQGGTLAGAGIMGALSALIVGPCVAPPLMGALIFIGQTGDAVLGFFALLGLGLGMGAPLLAIGTSAGKLLPQAGAWMDAVKAVFGVLLLAVAVLLLERILPTAIAMLLWGLLMISSGIYLGALTTLDREAGGWRKLWKSLGVALLIYGALLLVGAAGGGKDTLQPLRGLIPAGGGDAVAHSAFKRIKNVRDLDREVAAAAAVGRPVMLDFYADWCVSCKEMERYTFPDPGVAAAMRRFVLLQADVTANDAADKALMQGRFGLPGPPAILFYDAAGNELRGFRLVGFVPADEFAAHLLEVLR